MRTTVKYIRILPISSDYGTIILPIATKDGKLMTNRLIKVFSDYPPERIVYNRRLEFEILGDLLFKFGQSRCIFSSKKDSALKEEFKTAFYGQNPKDPFLTFAESCWTDIFEDNRPKDIEESQQNYITALRGYNDGVGNQLLIKQIIQANQRLGKFIRRHEKY